MSIFLGNSQSCELQALYNENKFLFTWFEGIFTIHTQEHIKNTPNQQAEAINIVFRSSHMQC